MDTPGTSIFQGANINLNNSRNEEEEEDLEDQKRRNEELQNLLMTKLDDFNYDESTMNSSVVSAISMDDAQNNYIKANNVSEQLKVLYEVRGRELLALREEHKNVTEKTSKEIDSLKRKCMLSEAELEQLKVSHRNSEELLIQKSECIRELTSVLESKEKQIQEYMKNTEDLHVEIATYKSTLDDLNLKVLGDRNPFSNSNKQFSSEEFKTAHKEQITRLETLLDEKTKQAKITEKENIVLKGELNKLVDANADQSKLINTLTNNFESAQKQCEDLIDVLETLSNENKHLQERLNNAYDSPNKSTSLDYNTLASHTDKLKKMLVDKSVQMNTLNAKLRNYEENLKELLEYRKMKSDAHQKEFQQCNNEDHAKNLIIMQNNLQNYRRIIEDKNQQILNLNSTNKDLLAKMEETLSQTRNDIQQFSNKYSLPQLEKMAENLKTAQNQITHLEEELKISEARRLSLLQKDANKDKSLKEELETLKLVTEKERNNFDNEIKKLQQELEISSGEINHLKQKIEDLLSENAGLQAQFENISSEGEVLKKQYSESLQALHESQKKVKQLQENMEELTNLKTIAEGEKCTFEFEAKDAQNHLEKSQKYIRSLEIDLDNKTKDLQGKDEMIQQLQEIISKLNNEINKISADFKTTECSSKQEEITKPSKAPESERKTRRNLDAELRVAEEIDEIERGKEENMITLEIKLREEIQAEYFKKLKQIENKYQSAYDSGKNSNKEHDHKLKIQETKFREYLSMILNECTQKIKELEENRENLIKNIDELTNQLHQLKVQTRNREEYLRNLILEMQTKNKRESEKWKLWSQKLVHSCLKIESTNKKSRDNISHIVQKYDSKIASVEKTYEKNKKKLNKK